MNLLLSTWLLCIGAAIGVLLHVASRSRQLVVHVWCWTVVLSLGTPVIVAAVVDRAPMLSVIALYALSFVVGWWLYRETPPARSAKQ